MDVIIVSTFLKRSTVRAKSTDSFGHDRLVVP